MPSRRNPVTGTCRASRAPAEAAAGGPSCTPEEEEAIGSPCRSEATQAAEVLQLLKNSHRFSYYRSNEFNKLSVCDSKRTHLIIRNKNYNFQAAECSGRAKTAGPTRTSADLRAAQLRTCAGTNNAILWNFDVTLVLPIDNRRLFRFNS